MDLEKVLNTIFNFITKHGISATVITTILLSIAIYLSIYFIKNKYLSNKNNSNKVNRIILNNNAVTIKGNNNNVNQTKVISQIVDDKIKENNKRNPTIKITDSQGNSIDNETHTIIYKRE